MLADTQMPISVVAARSGFANQANFNRQFKAVKALTPLGYRQQFAGAGTQERAGRAVLAERPPSLQGKARSAKGKRAWSRWHSAAPPGSARGRLASYCAPACPSVATIAICQTGDAPKQRAYR